MWYVGSGCGAASFLLREKLVILSKRSASKDPGSTIIAKILRLPSVVQNDIYLVSGEILCYNADTFWKNGGKTMELKNGRPENFAERLPKEQRVYELLDRLGIEYMRVDHEAAMTMEACVAVDEALEATMCKNLLLCNRQCTDFYLLLMPGGKPFKTSVLSKQIGSSRLSFADGAYMEQFLDITPGSLSVLGLMNDHEHRVRLLIDGDVLTGEYIGVHPCINTSSLRIRTSDLMEKLIPEMGHEPTMVAL